MAKNAKEFVVSTADFALYDAGQFACSGTTNLNTSIEVSMEEKTVQAGKGDKRVYSYKYGRELAVTLETANWDLKYLAANTGTAISVALTNRYAIGECATLTNYVATLPKTPIGKVAVDLGNGTTVEVEATGTVIDLTAYSTIIGTNKTVNVTYKFSDTGKILPIDADTSPKVYQLILDAEKHNNNLGKVGSVQIEIPSYQPSGNFNIEFTPDGVTSTNIDGNALAVEGDTCASGSAVYAYVREFDETDTATTVIDIAATPSSVTLAVDSTTTLSVYGLKGAMYSPILIENSECTFTSSVTGVATVTAAGVITAVSEGSAYISVVYGDHTDTIAVTVESA